MPAIKRRRKVGSIKAELLTKSRESMLAAVQIFNNPIIKFKSEAFVVLSNIAWTYLLHAYCRDKSIEYRYHKIVNKRKRFDKTKRGSIKFYELERCLDDDECPIDSSTKSNLKFLIGLRHEIEHQMTTRIDDFLSARFQACCINYNSYIKKLFGDNYSIDKHLSFSLQFSSLSEDHTEQLRNFTELPANIATYISDFDEDLDDDIFNDPKFPYRVFYVPKIANSKGGADRVIEFLKADSPEAIGINKEYRVVRDREKPKFLPSEIVSKLIVSGFGKFTMHIHTTLWKRLDGKNPNRNFSVQVSNVWYWYESWIKEVEKYCKEHGNKYR